MINLNAGNIYMTDDYTIFKRLDGNRDVNEVRVKKIINSINSVGYITSPIVVNEKYEVIDGQGRLKALEELGLPVYFVVSKGAGINECIAMNINQTNWSAFDYVLSYAEQGNENYVRLLKLVNAYPKLAFVTVAGIACGYSARSYNGPTSSALKSGLFSFTSDDYNVASKIISYLYGFEPVIRHVKGRKEALYSALAFCFANTDCDNNRLLEKITANAQVIPPIANTPSAIAYIEEIYNRSLGPANRIYFSAEYDKYIRG